MEELIIEIDKYKERLEILKSEARVYEEKRKVRKEAIKLYNEIGRKKFEERLKLIVEEQKRYYERMQYLTKQAKIKELDEIEQEKYLKLDIYLIIRGGGRSFYGITPEARAYIAEHNLQPFDEKLHI